MAQQTGHKANVNGRNQRYRTSAILNVFAVKTKSVWPKRLLTRTAEEIENSERVAGVIS